MGKANLNRVLARTRRASTNRNSFFEPLEARQHLSVTPVPPKVGAVSEAPSALIVSKVDVDRVSLSWKDNSTREIGFFVNRSNDGGKTWLAPIVISGANITTLLVKGLDEGSKYVFRVQAALPKKLVTEF